MSISFASDNASGVLPEVMEALQACNTGHSVAYGDDDYTRAATRAFKELFGEVAEPYFVFNGTAANVLAIKAMTRPYNAVICSANAHLHHDECGAPEALTGCKLVPVPTDDGKLRPEQIPPLLRLKGDQHTAQPKVIAISQQTEVGTVYSVAEIKALADLAHDNDMYLYIDGARLANATASLDVPVTEFTTDIGVDALSFGGTKNGMMFGEAVVLLNPELSTDFEFVRKQNLQLASKMRFIAAQFSTMLKDDLWLRTAGHSNRMAQLLYERVKDLPGVSVTRPVDGNAVFATIPPAITKRLQEQFYFYVWDQDTNEVRWMTAFDTTEADVDAFSTALRQLTTPQ